MRAPLHIQGMQGRWHLLVAALICLDLSFPASPAEARQPGTVASREPVLMVHPPEVQRVRNHLRKPFETAVPRIPSGTFHTPGFEPGGRNPGESLILPEPDLDFSAPVPEDRVYLPNQPGKSADLPLSRQPDNRTSLRQEMTALDDLDIGKYGGLVVPGGEGNREIRGFLHIPLVWGTQLQAPYNLKTGVIGLVEGINRYTAIRAETAPHLLLDSGKLAGTPFLCISAAEAFELTPDERRNLGEYLRNGGFAFLDNGTPQYDLSAAEASLRQMLRDALGCHARFEPIPLSHPIYHCYFEFSDGPPKGMEVDLQVTYTGQTAGYPAPAITLLNPVPALEGVFINGELVAVYSDKGYTVKWGTRNTYRYDNNNPSPWQNDQDNTPQLKMGVNLVVYALTREGGMNRRNLEAFSDIP